MKHWLRLMIAVIALGGTTACGLYIRAHPGVVYLRVAPPPVRGEVMFVAPGPGHAWVPGHWSWRLREYAWVPGVWITVERGYREWDPGRWAHDRHGWFWIEGRWR
jgi:hypothetical protein